MSKVNSSTILLTFVAVLFGLAGTYTLRQYLRQPVPVVEAVRPPAPPKRIVVPLASRDVPPGTQITLDDVALYRMTREEIKSKLKGHSFMTNPDQIVGKVVLKPILRNAPFHTQDFYPAGSSPGISNRIPSGTRAITILLDPTDALIGFAGAGEHVDVLFHYGQESDLDLDQRGQRSEGDRGQGFIPGHHHFNPPRQRDYYGNSVSGGRGQGGFDVESGLRSATVTLVQDAEIMALGRKSVPTRAASGLPDDEKVAVTLAVKPREAELLRVAAGHGELSLTLRGPSDEQKVALLDPVTLNEIIKVDDRIHEMVIHRGKSVSRLKFASGVELQRKVFEPQTVQNQPADLKSNPDAHPSPLPTINIVTPYPYMPLNQPAQGSGTVQPRPQQKMPRKQPQPPNPRTVPETINASGLLP